MTIEDIIKKRGIEEVLHFTTNNGITGMLDSRVVKSRNRLPKDKRLEYIIKYNCDHRERDAAWHSYINLSITSINMHLFGISAGKWHRGKVGWWCILSFAPEILCHPGVIFVTTNNIYSNAERGVGADGLGKLFAPVITRWEGEVVKRSKSTPLNQPTCPQAEVLYPNELSLDYLKRIYTKTEDNASQIESMFEVLSKPPAFENCIVRPDFFV
jgi:hypothetical protein